MRVEFEETYMEYEEIDDLSSLEDTDVPAAAPAVPEGAFPHPLYQFMPSVPVCRCKTAHLSLLRPGMAKIWRGLSGRYGARSARLLRMS